MEGFAEMKPFVGENRGEGKEEKWLDTATERWRERW